MRTTTSYHAALRAAAATPSTSIQQRVNAARQALLDQVNTLAAALGDLDPDDAVSDAQLAAMRSAGLRLAAAADAALAGR
jgi:hypothetical protein